MSQNFALFRARTLAGRIAFNCTIRPFLASCGKGSVILRPRGIEGIGSIRIGAQVFVSHSALLAAVDIAGTGQPAELHIGDGCKLGRNNHVYAARSVRFEEKVLTANNVYVSDNQHAFEDPALPVMDQPVGLLAPVRIGAGAWLGQNVCVIGASVGRGSVVGANSVVTRDVPDYCVAVGAPARVIRRLDLASGRWEPVPPQTAR